MNLPQKGTARPVKKVLGGILAVMAAGFAFNIEAIQNIVMDYPLVSIGAIGLSAYFLLISGRRE